MTLTAVPASAESAAIDGDADARAIAIMEALHAEDEKVADAKAVTETLLALSLDSRAEVDDFVARAIAKGAVEYAEPRDLGFMYQRGIADLDGHQWEVFFMDESQFPGA